MVVSFDDDVTGLLRSRAQCRSYDWGDVPESLDVLPPCGFRSLVQRAYLACHRTGAKLWGVSTSSSLVCMKAKGSEPRESLGLVIGRALLKLV